MGERAVVAPNYDNLYNEVLMIRRKGITTLRDLNLPAFRQACWAAGEVDDNDPVNAPQIEALLRRGVEELGGGKLGECAGLLFGLEPGTRGDDPTQLRRDAAERWGVSEARFRRDPQHRICSQIAEAVLLHIHQQQARLAHLNLERRLPTTSRLAIAWLERFEAYNRIWTPVSGLAGDLCAYRSTLLEDDRPYDRAPGINGPDDPGYTQEIQAAGYLTTALWHYTRYLVTLQQFINRHGGLWLLSDTRAEEAVGDAVYRIRWHSPNNERDDSFLRELHDRAGGELHTFRRLLETDRFAAATEQEWHEWAADCHCTWEVSDEIDTEHFPTHRHHAGISQRCQLHAISTACNDYTTLIDDDWRRVADWYRSTDGSATMTNDRAMYDGLQTQ